MFSGIIEVIGQVKEIKKQQSNLLFTISAPFAEDLKIDQSIAHNGACLTVVKKTKHTYQVVAIKETLRKTNLGEIKLGDEINLERAAKLSDRLDGHIVQGHVDVVAECIKIKQENGSTVFTFKYPTNKQHYTVEKGSITVNGVSLTVIDSKPTSFSVAIIPYTLKHTNLKNIKAGSKVNIEFDILGKYIYKILQTQKKIS